MKSWLLTLGFCLMSGLCYAHAMKIQHGAIGAASCRLLSLQRENRQLEEQTEELEQIICLQDDPAWIEMVLIRDLGLVPDGWLKVHFQK